MLIRMQNVYDQSFNDCFVFNVLWCKMYVNGLCIRLLGQTNSFREHFGDIISAKSGLFKQH